MLDYDHPKELITPEAILAECEQLVSFNDAYSSHPLIQRFGSPEQPIYIDDGNVDINGVTYAQPLIVPIYDGQMELVQCAVMQDGQRVAVIPDGLARGFARYGDFDHAKPVIITYSLEAFFKVAQTGYAVVLVVLPTLCNKRMKALKPFDFEQIQYVINQLSKSGFDRLYMPVRPEHIQLEPFQQLEQNTAVKLLNQYLKIDESEFLIELSKDESIAEVTAFIDEAIDLLPQKERLPKGHLAKPYRYGDGYFHILDTGVFFVEKDKSGNEYKRYVCSPILVKAKTSDRTSNDWGRLLVWTDDAGIEHRWAVSMELFQGDGVDLRKALAHQGVTIAPDRKARELFQCYLMTYPVTTKALCVDSVGWHGDIYVLPHQNIGVQDADSVVYQASHGLDNRYQQVGTLEQWRDEIAKPVQAHSKLVFSLSTAFAGQLLKPLGQQGKGFHLKGTSSKGKSTALYLACSVWGNPKTFFRTWKATGNALEHTAHLHNDGFLALDEIGEIANPRELGNTIYMLANGLGKGRMSRQLAMRELKRWDLNFLSNGECSLKDIMQENGQKTKLGQEIRLIEIDVDQAQYGVFDCIDFAEDGAKQSNLLNERVKEAYGVAGVEWLKYLTANKTERIQQAKAIFEQYQSELTAHHTQGHINRVASSFALVAVAGELATQAGITGWDAGKAFKSAKQVFDVWLHNFEYQGNYAEREILSQVKAFFEAHGSSRFESLVTSRHPDGEIIRTRIPNRVGYYDQDNKQYLVSSTMFKSEICVGMNENIVKQTLKNHGWLDCEDGRYTKRVSSNLPDGTRPTMMHFSSVAMSIFN
ncbi:DUF927 domain-containing protein [Acinetobacter seifertii]|uniref:DUF927 domain-containing protein n=1 Tax=Acinetobacter seifertii TaxID=1530123 RepID=UPI0032B36A8F